MQVRRLVVGLGVLAVGCAPPPWEDTAQPRVEEPPRIEILFPTTSVTTRYCPTFTVVAQVTDFALTEDGVGDGHWLLWEGPDWHLELLGSSSSAFLPLDEPLLPGTHVLYAELVTEDDQPLDPQVWYRTSIRVAQSNEPCVGGDAGWGETDTGGG